MAAIQLEEFKLAEDYSVFVNPKEVVGIKEVDFTSSKGVMILLAGGHRVEVIDSLDDVQNALTG